MQTCCPLVPRTAASLARSFFCAWMVLVVPAVSGSESVTNLLGFTAANASGQLELESKFDSLINPADQRLWLERMSAGPNHIGSPHNRTNAEFTLELFREWGWDAHIESFDVLYPTPKKLALEMVTPARFTARLHEPPLDGDRTSMKTMNALPPYHAYGADGDVTGELIYVNQGMPDDYKELDRRGISVKGRIAIARYGGGWRGLKPKLAHQHGAIGCLIYSDPHDDGYAAGDVYPKGGYRPADGVQRGSVADLPIHPGDPLTPGVGATAEARRLSIQDSRTVLKIPVMPISYADAQPLLSALGGPVAPPNWRGALPVTYHIGPGPATVHLSIASDWSLKPIHNVIATLRGDERPDEWVIRGNHRDAWVFGAWDPLSGHVAMMAEAKAIGALVKGGWKPKRTLIYASWDGEEAGLLGSTEWAETHDAELRRKAVLYLNCDDNGRGFLRAGGSHSLQTLVNQVAAGIRDPQTGATALERLRAKTLVDGARAGAEENDQAIAKRVAAGAAPPLYPLGSGSDYSPFLQHLGIPSLDIRYGGEDKSSGVYHSVYDSFDHYVRFGDPDFAYGVALAKTIGHAILRFADADVLPMQFGDFSETIGQYVDELHKLADRMRERTKQQHRLLDENAYQLAADPTEPEAPPPRESSVPFLNFAPLDNARSRLTKSAKAYDEACSRIAGSDSKFSRQQFSDLNAQLQGIEQTLLHPQGLPGRDWYRHMIYAPGLHTGYGAKTLPGVREAIEQRRWPEVDSYITIVAGVLNAYSDRLDQAAAVLKR